MNVATRPLTATGARVAFGAPYAEVELEPTPILHVAMPVLAGPRQEELASGSSGGRTSHGFQLFADGPRTIGFSIGSGDDLEAASADLYRRLFAATQGLHLHRVWNYVPGINAVTDGLENYRRFSRQRSLVFEDRFGPDYRHQLPAASAVGTLAGPVALEFIAGPTEPRRHENPRQVPAFEYPREYGPRPPSFSRATVTVEGGRQRTYISGTAAITGHATVAANDLAGQLACTLTNLGAIGTATGAGADLGRSSRAVHRRFRVYLRHAADLAQARPWLERELLRPSDAVLWLQADICRRDLLVEVEASIEVLPPAAKP